jgi:AI-2 transport protein TqsA
VIDFQVAYLRFPRGLAIVGAGLFGLLVLLLFGFLAAQAVGQFTDRLDAYVQKLNDVLRDLADWPFLRKLGVRADAQAGPLLGISEDTTRHLLTSLLGAIVDIISTGALVLVFMLFMLLGRHQGVRAPTSVLAEVENRVRYYLLKMVGLSALTGLLVGLTLAAFGVELAWAFGFLTFLLNFIPNVGSIIATLLPLPVIWLSPDLPIVARVLAVAAPGAIQFVIGSAIQPRVLGGALDLHPVAVLMALIFFGMIWGIVGAFLALPITGVIKIVLARIPATRPAAAVLAGDLTVLAQPAAAAASAATGQRAHGA